MSDIISTKSTSPINKTVKRPDQSFERSNLSQRYGKCLKTIFKKISEQNSSHYLKKQQLQGGNKLSSKKLTEEQTQKLNKLNLINQIIKPFRCSGLAKMSLSDYLNRFVDFAQMSDEVLIVSSIYLKKAIRKLYLTDQNCIHRLLSASLFLAFKYVEEDGYWSLENFSLLSGVKIKELEKMEKRLLAKILKYKLYVSDEEYANEKKFLDNFDIAK